MPPSTYVVRTTGFEPAASCSQSKRSTKLSHVRVYSVKSKKSTGKQEIFLLRCPVCALPKDRLRCPLTAATRSGRFFCLRQRFPRSPVAVPSVRLADRLAALTADRGHSLGSLNLTQAALPSLHKLSHVRRWPAQRQLPVLYTKHT